MARRFDPMGAHDPYVVCCRRGATGAPAACYAFMSAARVVAAGRTLAITPWRDRSGSDIAPLHGN